MNGKPNSTVFERFWDEVSLYLEEITPACDDCRHGNTLHMPIAISVSNLRDIIEGRLSSKFPSEGIAIPSVEWIRLQFSLLNPYAANSIRNTGRFEVKFAVQKCQLCKNHPDSKYVMVLLKCVREYAVRFADHVLLASVDDKAVVPIGEPGLPISTGAQQVTSTIFMFLGCIRS